MLPGLEMMGCQDLAVPAEVMHHVVRVESSGNPFAIGVVGARLARQPRSAAEAVATAKMLESKGYNFSVGLAQVNRHNLTKYGLHSYGHAFETCPNLHAGARILSECHSRSGHDWGRSFSCYYSGNFTTGFRHGYVQRVFASMGVGKQVGRHTTADRRSADLVLRRSTHEARARPAQASPAMAVTPVEVVHGVARPVAQPPSGEPSPSDMAFVF